MNHRLKSINMLPKMGVIIHDQLDILYFNTLKIACGLFLHFQDIKLE